MKKAERINDMMIYLNEKKNFNLSDLMDHYDISKSTALRDIQSLEKIGMPIYSELGRFGRYGLLKNRLLSPITFTLDEMNALYFSMLNLRQYHSIPFNLDIQKLKQKFEACITKDNIDNLLKMESILKLSSTQQTTETPLLKEVLYSAMEESIQTISYLRKGTLKDFTVQFLLMSSSFGQWYATGYNYDSKSFEVFRCDKIRSIKPAPKQETFERKNHVDYLEASYNNTNATYFEVTTTSRGADLFAKENYPSMKLDMIDGSPVIKGFYKQNETAFIAHYFQTYSQEIIAMKPNELKALVIQKAQQDLHHFQQV